LKPVLHLITTIERGGAEVQLLTVVAEQHRLGRKVYVAYLKGSPELEEDLRISGAIIVKALANRNPVFQLLKLKSFLRNRDLILHCHLPRAEILGAIAKGGSRLIVTRHNSEPFFPGAPTFISILLSRFVALKAMRVIAISNAVRDYLIQASEVGNKKKIITIHYGLTPSFTKLSKYQIQEFKRTLGIPNNSVTIGTIGRLVPQKDYSTLLSAFQTALSQNQNLYLVVVGDGVLRSELLRTSAKMGISENIVWVGKTANVFEVLQLMDIFILASKYEGFGLVLLEALVIGMRVIASRNSSIPEVLGQEYEFLFETGHVDQLSTLIDKAASNINIVASRKYADERLSLFTAESMIGKMEEVYERVEA
jgi:glycosyltransferase involved in cell wall biosynthesis